MDRSSRLLRASLAEFEKTERGTAGVREYVGHWLRTVSAYQVGSRRAKRCPIPETPADKPIKSARAPEPISEPAEILAFIEERFGSCLSDS